MDPEPIVLKQLRSDVRYRGSLEGVAWRLLAESVPLYKNMLEQLGPFGATLRSLRVETANLATAHIGCSLPDLDTDIRVHLDRVEFDCWKLHQVGSDAAQRLLRAVWAAIHASDDSIQPGAHTVDLSIFAEVVDFTSAQMLSRYVRIPAALASMDTGVAFYAPPIACADATWVNLVLDRVFKEDDHILIKATVGCAASTVPVESIAQTVEGQLVRVLSALGLHLEPE